MTTIRLEDILTLDVEASGLHVGSYPIQIAWSTLDLEADGFLIRRPATWGDDDWAEASFQVHGISREMLDERGIDVDRAAGKFWTAVAGKHLVSDNPDHDTMWICRFLAETAAQEAPTIWHSDTIIHSIVSRAGVVDITHAEDALRRARETYPHTHDARDDAIRLAAGIKAVWDSARGLR